MTLREADIAEMTRFEGLFKAVSDALVGVHQSAARRAQTAQTATQRDVIIGFVKG
jgi:hypothetical protein